MFGSVVSVDNYNVQIENKSKKVDSSLVGLHVVFETGLYKVVGEINSININYIDICLVGEFTNGTFMSGIIHKPSNNSIIRLINREEVIILLGNQEIEGSSSVYLGKSLTYMPYNVSADLNSLFSNHFIIMGNTGSGKSSFVARMFQNLFYRKNNIPLKSNIVLFDVYGEYHNAFKNINNTKYCRYKAYTTDTLLSTDNIVKIPLWFLDVDDLALLLNVDSSNQIPIIEKALRLVYLFTEEEGKVINHKNSIISKAVLDILTSGKNPTQIRDQVIAVLTTYNTKDINLESQIIQPGYIRTLKQCLNIDQSGKINTIHLVIEYLEKYIEDNVEMNLSSKPEFYTLKDLYSAFEFALLSEGVLKSDKVYDLNNILKVRLDSIINSNYANYFDVSEPISKSSYINSLFTSPHGEKVQLLNFNLNYVDERFAKVLTKIYCKLFLDYAISLNDRGSFPIQIILEEAHRYVQNDTDVKTIGYNIFDRITKEGRKYGVVLGLITQRPSEISTTSLSQCSNYIALRMFHPEDLDIIKNITHSITETDVDKLKTLRPGVALCFGTAFKIPVLTKIDMPVPSPDSGNAVIKDIWFSNNMGEK